MIHVYIISAVPFIRTGLSSLIESDPECHVVASEAPSGETMDHVADAGPDVVLIETDAANMPEMVEMFGSLGATASDVRPILVAPMPDEARLVEPPTGRPWGYLPGDTTGEKILAAIHAVAAGLVAVDPVFAASSLSMLSTTFDSGTNETENLSPREQEVLQLIAVGLPNKSIAGRLGISEHTVKFHVASILSKLGAASRAEAVRLGARRGMVTL